MRPLNSTKARAEASTHAASTPATMPAIAPPASPLSLPPCCAPFAAVPLTRPASTWHSCRPACMHVCSCLMSLGPAEGQQTSLNSSELSQNTTWTTDITTCGATSCRCSKFIRYMSTICSEPHWARNFSWWRISFCDSAHWLCWAAEDSVRSACMSALHSYSLLSCFASSSVAGVPTQPTILPTELSGRNSQALGVHNYQQLYTPANSMLPASSFNDHQCCKSKGSLTL